jgi:hypothetical protein
VKPGAFHYSSAMWTGERLDRRRRLEVTAKPAGEVCLALPRARAASKAPDGDPTRYAVVDVGNGVAPGPLRVHLYDLGPERGYRLVAIERPEDGSPDF